MKNRQKLYSLLNFLQTMKYFVILIIVISSFKFLNGETLLEKEKSLISQVDGTKEQYGRPPYMGRYPYGQGPYGGYGGYGGPRGYGGYGGYGGPRGYGGYGGYGGRYNPYWTTTTLGFPFNLFGKK